MQNYQKLKGLVAATFTPMHPDGEINYAVIDHYAQHIADAGIAGVFVCGTTGEFTSLTTGERKKILEHWVQAAGGRFRVIAHVGSDCQRDAMELARHAAETGAAAIASIAPSFFKPATVRELISFFRPVAAAAPTLPFYYYNMPSMTGVSLSVEQFLQEGRKEIPTLAGVKFTHNNLMEMGECIRLDGGAFEVLHGFDETLICGLALGAVAGVGSTYNYLPSVYLNIMKAMEENDLEKARTYQRQSVEIVNVIIRYGGGVRGGKAIMNLIGIACGECRPPLASFGKEEVAALRSDLEQIGYLKK